MSTADRLAAIYASIPSISCRGLCVGACGPVPVHVAELVQIRALAGKRVRAELGAILFGIDHPKMRLLRTGPDMVCTQLRRGRCAVYDARPLICRLYGVAEGLPCAFRCKPERILSLAEVNVLIGQVLDIGKP